MLDDLEGLKVYSKETGDKIVVTIDNKIKGALPPKKQDIMLFTGMTISEVKLLVAQKLNPPKKPEEFDLVSKGIWLTESKKSLKEYK